MATPTIRLTPGEKRLKGLLLDVAESINASPSQTILSNGAAAPQEPLVLRWAGGWVRDKLLGIDTQDIDVAINRMTGEELGRLLGVFCKNPAVVQKYAMTRSDLGSLHTIKANPEKSKNLATATCRIFGADVDFVNLRKETYSGDSRNPEIEFGTAAEDASRRDATVNALFYNLHTGEVEDFVGGLPDLRAGLIRTPLQPLQTFTDDPLRVLRLVRFASRLGFSIDPDTKRVMSDSQVLESLKIKISRERVGIEIGKMLRGNHPSLSLELVDCLGLYHAIFTNPTSEGPSPDISSWRAAYGFLNAGARDEEFAGPIYSRLIQGDEEAYSAWTLAAFAPWDGVENPNVDQEKPRMRNVPLITRAAREGIKAPNKLCDIITAAHAHKKEVLELKQLVCSRDLPRAGRDVFGMALRRWGLEGGNWRLPVVYAILVESMEELKTWPVQQDSLRFFSTPWLKFLDHIEELDLANAPSIKPLVDGKLLAQSLHVKGGRWMAGALDACLAWQFRNPGAEDPAGAIEEVNRRREEFQIPDTPAK